MLPISQNDMKKCAVAQKILEAGSQRVYQAHAGDVLVHHIHTAHRVSAFTTKDDGHYIFDEDCDTTDTTLATYFIKPKAQNAFSLPISIIKSLYREITSWLQSSSQKDYEYIEFEYGTNVEEHKTFYRLVCPGTIGKMPGKTWALEMDALHNDMSFRAVMQANEFAVMLYPFTKLKEGVGVVVVPQLSFSPGKMKASEGAAKPVYQGDFYIDAHMEGHDIQAVYANKAIYVEKPETEASDVEYKQRSGKGMDSLFEDSDITVNTSLTDEQKQSLQNLQVYGGELPEAKKQLTSGAPQIEAPKTEETEEWQDPFALDDEDDASDIISVQAVSVEEEYPDDEEDYVFTPENVTVDDIKAWAKEMGVSNADAGVIIIGSVHFVKNCGQRGIPDDKKQIVADFLNTKGRQMLEEAIASGDTQGAEQTDEEE